MLTCRAARVASLAAVLFWTIASPLPAAVWDWNFAGGGAWGDPTKWSGPGVGPPNAAGETARFAQDMPNNASFVITGVGGTVGQLMLQDTDPGAAADNYNGWILQGGPLTIQTVSGPGLISMRDSIHVVQSPVVLMQETDIVYTYAARDQRGNIDGPISSGAGLTTDVHINRVNPYGTGSFGRVVWYGNNTFNGNVTIHNGNLQIGNGNAIPNASDVQINAGAMLTMISSEAINALNGEGTVRTHPGFGTCTLTVGASGGSGSFSGVIRDDGTGITALIKAGAGTQTLSGPNTYTGGTTIRQGTLSVANSSALGSTGAIVLGDVNTGANAVALRSTVNFARDITVSSNGTGLVTIAGDTNYITFSGTLTLNRATTLGGTAGDRYAYSGKITGNVGTLTIDAPRITLEQSAANASDFTGSVVINSGRILQFNSIYGLSNQHAVTANGSLYLNVGNGSQVSIGSLSGTGYAGLHPGVSGTQTLSLGGDNGNGAFSGTLSNGGGVLALIKTGAGTQTLSGASTFTGTTTVSAGTLLVGDPAALGAGASAIQLGDANTGANNVALLTDTWGTSGYLYFDRNISVNNFGSGTITIGTNAAGSGGRPVEFRGTIALGKDVHLKGTNVDRTSFTNSITGTGNVYIDGPQRVTLTGNNSYVGDTFISASMAQLQGGNAIPDASNVTVAAGAILRIWDASESINGLNGSGYVQIGNSARTLTVGAAGGSGSYSGVLRNEGTGVLSLIKAGAGTQTLSGYSTYTGSTTVTAGRLLVNNTAGSGTGSGNVLVSGGMLGGNGLIAGGVTVNAPGTISAGNSPGHLSIGGPYVQTGTMLAEIGGYNQGATTADGYDWISVGGAATLDGTLMVDLLGGFRPQTGDKFYVLTASGGITDNRMDVVFDPAGLLPAQYFDYRIVTWTGAGGGQAVELFVGVPEPSTFALLVFGLAGLLGYLWRRRRRG